MQRLAASSGRAGLIDGERARYTPLIAGVEGVCADRAWIVRELSVTGGQADSERSRACALDGRTCSGALARAFGRGAAEPKAPCGK